MKILFITHSASRTGAPLILFKFLQWLKDNTNNKIHTLIKESGELNNSFSNLGITYIWSQHSFSRSIFNRIMTKIKLPWLLYRQKKTIINEIKNHHYDLIYANTIASSDVLFELLKFTNPTIVMHVHELEMAIDLYCDREKFNAIKSKIIKFIAVSEIVKTNLIKNHGIPEDKIELVHEFAVSTPALNHSFNRDSLLINLNIPTNAFIIGGSGTIEWRKGTDLFVQIAKKTIKQEFPGKPIYFVWLGGYSSNLFLNQIRYDVEVAELKSRILFLGSKENPSDFFKLFDLFLLTSREDPFPLVCLENGGLGKPILCFDRQVGCLEYLDETCGSAVSYLDTGEMTEAIMSFYIDQDKLEKASLEIIKRTSPFQIENQGPKLLKIIEKFSPGSEIPSASL